MTEWGVVGVLVVLAGLVVTLVTPMLKLNTTMTRLVTLVEEISRRLEVVENTIPSEHRNMNEHIGQIEKQVNKHETRITVLEKKEGIEHHADNI